MQPCDLLWLGWKTEPQNRATESGQTQGLFTLHKGAIFHLLSQFRMTTESNRARVNARQRAAPMLKKENLAANKSGHVR